MVVTDQTNTVVTVAEGVQRKTLAVGEKSLMVKFLLAEGAAIPAHQHPHEQIGYLVSGQIVLTIGGKDCEFSAGDSWAIPGGVEHAAQVIKRAEAIEVFVPIREDYL